MVEDPEKPENTCIRIHEESFVGDLVWADEFGGTSVDREIWNFELGTGTNGWGNAELQYYRPENARVRDWPGGRGLAITARAEPFGGRYYTSARLQTLGKVEFTYGRVEARVKLPRGRGMWPALWLLGASFPEKGWPACGEIDILEMVGGPLGGDHTVHGTVHWEESGHRQRGGKLSLPSALGEEFHVYSLDWTPEALTWAVDGVEFHRHSITEGRFDAFHQPFFLVLNLAVGGKWPGYPDETTLFPQDYLIEWVRIFQHR